MLYYYYFLLSLSLLKDSGKEFVLSGIHVKPDDAPTEIDELTTVYDSIESTLGTSVSIDLAKT